MPRRAGLLTAFSLLLIALLGSCHPRETPVQEGIRTGTLLVGNGAEPADLDPQVSTILTDQIIEMALFEGLTSLDEQTTLPVPAAAERWEVSPDGLVWTFHLRAGLRWSNGDPLSADDFLQSWRRILNPAFASGAAWYLYPVKNAEAFNSGKLTDLAAVGLAAPDARTIVITLEHPTPYLPALVSLPGWFPVNPRVLAKFGGWDKLGSTWTRAGHLVGNGPFTLTEWTPNARIVVEKNPHYWAAAATQLHRIIFFPTDNTDTEERSFRAGQLHVTRTLPLTKLAAWREHDPAQLRLDPQTQANYLRFNVTRPPFNDARVRQAFALAIDRPLLARTVLLGSHPAATAFTPPGTGGYTARASVGTDFAAARRLLAEAGYAEGRGLPAIELQTVANETFPRVCEALQAMWQRELGVRVTLTQVEQKTWIQNQQSLNYTLITSGWTADFPDPVTYLNLFTSDSSYNWTGWKNPAYDRLLDEAGRTIDSTQRYELFQEAEALLLHEAPITPVFLGAQTYLIHPAVRGWVPAPLVLRRFQQVSLQEP